MGNSGNNYSDELLICRMIEACGRLRIVADSLESFQRIFQEIVRHRQFDLISGSRFNCVTASCIRSLSELVYHGQLPRNALPYDRESYVCESRRWMSRENHETV